jgi:hypothetical protein
MPDVGLTSAAEPLDPNYKIVIKYTIEVEGLAVYSESYDVEKLRREIKENEEEARANWFRRIKCVVECQNLRDFSACLTRCLLDGRSCPEGKKERGR